MAFPPQGTNANETFQLTGPFTTLHDGIAYLDGSGGFDILRLSGAGQAVLDFAWGGVSNFEALLLASGSWSFTLGGAAANAFSGRFINIEGVWASQVNVDGSALAADVSLRVVGSANADTIIGGAGVNVFDGHGGADLLTGGASGDFFWFDNAGAMAAAQAEGGGGADTIVIRNQATINDIAFLGMGGMEALQLRGSGAQVVTLGETASAAFGPHVGVSAVNANGLYLDAGNLSRKLYATATAGQDEFVLGGKADAVLFGFTTHGNANADQVVLLGHDMADVQAMLANAVQAAEGTYLYHDGHHLLFAGVAKAALSTADFIFA